MFCGALSPEWACSPQSKHHKCFSDTSLHRPHPQTEVSGRSNGSFLPTTHPPVGDISKLLLSLSSGAWGWDGGASEAEGAGVCKRCVQLLAVAQPFCPFQPWSQLLGMLSWFFTCLSLLFVGLVACSLLDLRQTVELGLFSTFLFSLPSFLFVCMRVFCLSVCMCSVSAV